MNSVGGRTRSSSARTAGMDSSRTSGRPGPFGGSRKRDGLRRHLGVEDCARADLVPVVVFGLDPEHRHRGDAVLARHLLGELDRGHRLEHRVERTAEEPGLLTGHDRDGARVGEVRGGLDRGGRRAAPLLLRARWPRSRAIARLGLPRATAASTRPNRPGCPKKTARPREVIRVVGGELRFREIVGRRRRSATRITGVTRIHLRRARNATVHQGVD